jgi:hypothetical protein
MAVAAASQRVAPAIAAPVAASATREQNLIAFRACQANFRKIHHSGSGRCNLRSSTAAGHCKAVHYASRAK